ncbi:MAG TPA: type VI secretion system contractile sheath large subunit [Candidatus Methylomirabilis sp.]|nr:type VI secretion system contractile sheath large subunit [Candidatus Methylomirabilis sp.]
MPGKPGKPSAQRKPISFGEPEFHLVASMEETTGRPEPDTPFRVALLGDFSGRANRGVCEPGEGIAERRPREVDRDNLDEVMAKLGVEVRLPMGKEAPPLALRFRELEDFHPDRLFERVELLQRLGETRRRLSDPVTFSAAATELKRKEPRPLPGVADLVSGNLLDQVLETTEGPSSAKGPSPDTSAWGAFLREIVRPHLVPRDDPRQAEMIAAVDEAAAGLVRAILHHPDVHALESAWRALRFVVSRLETGDQLKLFLLDVSRDELAADLASAEDLRVTGAYRLLVEQTVETPGAEPWAVLAGNFTFGPTRADAELLGRLGKVARRAGAPFLAAADTRLLGCESLAKTPDPDDWGLGANAGDREAWQALRALPEAAYVGLALPRFLLRLPYGPDTEPAERFEFDEMPGEPLHEHYLWGNPAMACASLLGQEFSESGWAMRPGTVQEIGGLPIHSYKSGEESKVTPCAEVVLTERAAEAILEKGIMPLLSFKGRDTVRLARFQSLTDPATRLAGRWGGR